MKIYLVNIPSKLARLLCILPMPLIQACSVAMALHGNQQPNFQAFEVGSKRKHVEIQLGQPVDSHQMEDGKRRDTYRFEMGNSPNGHRAIMNLYLDLVTFGLWEIPGTVVEGIMGEEEETHIIYGPDGTVLAIEGYSPPEPLEEIQEANDAQ